MKVRFYVIISLLGPTDSTPLQASIDFGDTMKPCDKNDCKQSYFFNELFRWVKKALVDIGG